MMAELILTLEDTEHPISASLYAHPGKNSTVTWLRIGRALLEIQGTELIDATIRILKEIRAEVPEEMEGK